MINVRKKGNSFELKVAKIFSQVFDLPFVRVPNSGGLYLKGDIMVDPTKGDFPFVIECKNVRRYPLTQWEKQLLEEMAYMKKLGILVFHRHGSTRDYAYVPYFPVKLADREVPDVRNTKFMDVLDEKSILKYHEGYIGPLMNMLLTIKFYMEQGEKYEYTDRYARKTKKALEKNAKPPPAKKD